MFIQEAVEALYQAGKEMDWLNLTTSEVMPSVKSELSKITEAFRVFPEDMKQALSNLQQRQEQSLLEEQSKLRVCEAKTTAALQYTGSRLTGHDNKINDMSVFINSLADKLSKFEEQQDNVLKVLRSIDHTVYEINARKGKVNQDANRETSQRRNSDQELKEECLQGKSTNIRSINSYIFFCNGIFFQDLYSLFFSQ
ncbi:hypothetical protein OROHE_015977 [Orobanche hederae]